MTNGRLRPVKTSGRFKRPKCRCGPTDGPVLPILATGRADLHGVADLHAQAPRLQVPVDREDVRGDLEHHLVAAEVRHVSGVIGLYGVRPACRPGRDDGSIGDREHIRAEGVELLVRAAVPVVEPVALDQGPVDGEGLGGLDAATVDDESKISVEVRLAAGGGGEPTIPLEGRLDHGGGVAVDRDLGAVDHGRVHEHRVDESAGMVYAIRCVTRSGTVPGVRIRSTSTETAADAGISATVSL